VPARNGWREQLALNLGIAILCGMECASNAELATRNGKHFEDIAASDINPWQP
jgi:hypothetical protein